MDNQVYKIYEIFSDDRLNDYNRVFVEVIIREHCCICVNGDGIIYPCEVNLITEINGNKFKNVLGIWKGHEDWEKTEAMMRRWLSKVGMESVTIDRP